MRARDESYMPKELIDFAHCCICGITEKYFGCFKSMWEVFDPEGTNFNKKYQYKDGLPKYICDRCIIKRTMTNLPEIK